MARYRYNKVRHYQEGGDVEDDGSYDAPEPAQFWEPDQTEEPPPPPPPPYNPDQWREDDQQPFQMAEARYDPNRFQADEQQAAAPYDPSKFKEDEQQAAAPYDPSKWKEDAQAEGAWGAFTREALHGAPPAVAAAATGIAVGAATQALVPIPGSGIVGGLIAGFGGGMAGEVATDKIAKGLGIEDDAVRAANIKEHPFASAAGQAVSNLAGFSPRGVASAATRMFSAGVSGAGEAASQIYQKGKDFFTPEGIKEAAPFIAAQTAMGAAAPNLYKWGEAIEKGAYQVAGRFGGRIPEGHPAAGGETRPPPPDPTQQGQTPGSETGPGVAQEPKQPQDATGGDPQNKATIGETGEREKGGENLNTTGDRYKKPEATPPATETTEIPDAFRQPNEADYRTPAYTGESTERPSRGMNTTETGIDPTVEHTIRRENAPEGGERAPGEGRPGEESVASEPRAPSAEAPPRGTAAEAGSEPARGPGERQPTRHEQLPPQTRVHDPRDFGGAAREPPGGRPAETRPTPQNEKLRATRNPDSTWSLKKPDGTIVGTFRDLGEARKAIAAQQRATTPPGRQALERSGKLPLSQRMIGTGTSHPGLRWQVVDRHTGRVMGEYNNRRRANGRVDKLDNAYGGYRYQVKQTGVPEIRRYPLERGRSGRPIETQRLPIGTEQRILERGARKVEEGVPPGTPKPPERQAAARQGPDLTKLTDQELIARGRDPKLSIVDRDHIINEMQRRQTQKLQQPQQAQQTKPLPTQQQQGPGQRKPPPPPPPPGGPPPGGPQQRPPPAQRQVAQPRKPVIPPVPATKHDLQRNPWASIQRWLGVRASSTESGRAARNIYMGAEGRAERARQVAASRFTDGMHRLLNRTTPGEQRMLVNWIQGGNHFPNYQPKPEFLAVVKQLRQIYKDFETYITSMPKFQQMQFWDNSKYLTGQYKDPTGAQHFYSTYAEGGPKAGGGGSMHKRKFPTDEDARAAGYEPASTNPIQRVLTYVDSMSRFLSRNQQIEEGKASGYIKYYGPEAIGGAGTPQPGMRNAPPPGWAKLDNVRDQGGRNAFAPTEYAATFNNAHSPGIAAIIPEDIVTGARRAINTYTAVELAGPAYHFLNTMHEGLASHWGTALSQLMAGRPLSAAGSAVKGVLSPLSGLPSMRGFNPLGAQADRITDVYLKRAQNVTPQEKAIVDAMEKSNWKPIGVAHTLDYDMSRQGSLWNSAMQGAWKAELKSELNKIYGALQGKDIFAALGVPFNAIGRLSQTIAHPLFQYYIPRMKAVAAYDNIRAWLDVNPHATPNQLRDESVKILKSIDNRMGEMAHDNMLMNRGARDAMALFMRSPSFSIGGVIREITAGGLSLGRGALKGENRTSLASKNYDPRTAYFLSFFAGTAAITATYQYLKTGKMPDQDDLHNMMLGVAKTGGEIPGVGGKTKVPELAIMPGYNKDFRGYYHDFWGELKNKMPGLYTAIIEQAQNRQMTNIGPKPIVPPGASTMEELRARLSAFGERSLPIMAKQAKETPYKGSNISYPEQVMGIRSPGTWQRDPDAWQKAADKREQDAWDRYFNRENLDRSQRGLPPLEKQKKYEEGGEVEDYGGDVGEAQYADMPPPDEQQYVDDGQYADRQVDWTQPTYTGALTAPSFRGLNDWAGRVADRYEPSENVEDRRNDPPYEPSMMDRISSAASQTAAGFQGIGSVIAGELVEPGGMANDLGYNSPNLVTDPYIKSLKSRFGYAAGGPVQRRPVRRTGYSSNGF